MFDKIKNKYGKDLPGKSAFRNDPEAPCTVEEISEEFGSWDNFVVKYNEALVEKPKAAKEPVKTTTKAKDNEAK